MTAKHVLVVGAGLPGLATAWSLQERGIEVTVLDGKGVAGGSSWGNAGWVSPALTLPLNAPAILRAGVRSALSPSSPVYVPPTLDLRLLAFLGRFAAQCTPGRWERSLELFIEVNRRAVAAFETLVEGGVDEPLRCATPFLAAFRTEAERDSVVHELEVVRGRGGTVEMEELTGDQLRGLEPSLTGGVTCGFALRDQRFIDPGRFVHALARQVQARGGVIRAGAELVQLSETSPAEVLATLATGEVLRADCCVLATGAWLSRHARAHGVRIPVQAGRGYSFTVRPARTTRNPIYFPVQRVACTPIGTGLRLAGMMEFRPPDAPLDPRRITAIVNAIRPLVDGVDWDARTEEWVGSRPCTPDGLPLVGRTRATSIYVTGGHGMWGVALGPLTGDLLAQQIVTGERPAMLAGFDPLR